MTEGNKRPMAERTRQELLDELYYLRDVAGEREQRLQQLGAQLRGLEDSRAMLLAALREVLKSRSWRLTRPLRGLHPGRACDPRLDRLVQAEDAAVVVRQASSPAMHPEPLPVCVAARRDDRPCLYVDVSDLVRRQGHTGIQRVVREIAHALLVSPPGGFEVVLVRAAPGQSYRCARAFAAELTGAAGAPAPDCAIEVRSGDIFLGLDHAMDDVAERTAALAAMKAAGVRVYFVLNDVLPLSHPEWFPPDVPAMFERWFKAVAGIADGVACISNATATQARDWLERLQVPRTQWPALGWFHLGADNVVKSADSVGVTPEQQEVLARLHDMPVFLMVGTLEPRKGHAQALEAFNQLWAEGENTALVLVGWPGWMTEVIQRRIRHHDEFGTRLFWFMQASDALLDRLYDTCTALLMPSEGEGFGLPLVEAARHGVPILCRDLPVFHEVAGDQATYFRGRDAASLVRAIRDWLAVHRGATSPSTTGVRWQTWADSAAQLVNLIQGFGHGHTPAHHSQGAKQA
jgi:glycosyltransferase involved in cell wall biosynthesis